MQHNPLKKKKKKNQATASAQNGIECDSVCHNEIIRNVYENPTDTQFVEIMVEMCAASTKHCQSG